MFPDPIMWFDIVIQTEHRISKSRIYVEPAAAPTTSAALQSHANAFSTAIAPKIKDFIASSCRYVGVYARRIAGTSDLEVTSTSGGGGGSADDPPMPDEVAAIIQKRTGNSGRDKRGRYFIIGASTVFNDDGVLTEDGQTPLAALATFLGADVVAGGFTWHMRHYDRKTNALVPVTQCRPVSVFGSRRDRRKPLQLVPF